MTTEIENFRAKYPQYGDMDDTTLANKLAEKYPDAYGDLPQKVKQASIPIPKKESALEPIEEEIPSEPLPTDLDFDMSRRSVQSLRPLGEAAAAMGTGIVGNAAAGYTGLAELAHSRDLQKATQAIEKTKQALIYKPKTEAGMEILNLVNLPYKETLGKLAPKVGGYLEEQGYPNAGAAAHTLIEAGPLLFQLGRMAGRPTLTSIDSEIQNTISKGIEKSIRPSVQGKRTYSQSQQYMENAKNAVTQIVREKDNLTLTNEAGEVVRGQLPENLKQFSQAIEQTRQKIFSEYDALQTQAGQAGAGVALDLIVKELRNVAGSKVVKDHHPEIAEYATKYADRLEARGTYTTTEAQDAIATLNSKLESFYKNPSYENSKMANVDAMIANKLRGDLDIAIEKATGEAYQPLKNMYGSLKSIERDVNRRALVDARQNPKGLIDFSDIFSGSQVVNGIMRLDPATVGAGVAAKSIARYIKWINNPNRIVKGMFKDTEELLVKREALAP